MLRERYGSAKQEEKFQAELCARRRKVNEDIPTLRADISQLMSLAFPGDVSSMGQKMAIDYFLDALDDPDFVLKIRRVSRTNLNEAYTRALRVEMIRKKVQKRELVEDAPVKHGKHTRAVEVDVSWLALNQEYQRMTEEMQMSTHKRIEENQAANQTKIEEQLSAMALAQKTVKLQQTKIEAAMASKQNATQFRQQSSLLYDVKMLAPEKPDYSNLKCFN